MSSVIPFGKHKGRTVEQVLAIDSGYFRWMAGNADLREKFKWLLDEAAGITGPVPGTDDDSPEHNAIQVRFLNAEFCAALLDMFHYEGEVDPSSTSFEGISDVNIANQFFIEIKPSVGDDYPSHMRQIRAQKDQIIRRMGNGGPFGGSRWDHFGCVIILLYDQYTGSLPEADVREMFTRSDICVIKLSEIDERIATLRST